MRLKAIVDSSLPKAQIGFQSKMSSDLALWLAQMLAHEQHREKREAWFLLCDWSKCFDRVWRSLTLLLLHAKGVRGKLWLAIEAWINGTTVTAFFLGVFTDPFLQESGLGQGCVLSAFLFLIWMSTLTESAPYMCELYPYKGLILKAYEHSLPKSWGMKTAYSPEGDAVPALILADDTTLLANSLRNITRLACKLESWKRMSRAIASAKKFQLCVHPNKTGGARDTAVVGTIGGEYTVVIDDMEIPAALTAKLLGGVLSHPNDIRASQMHLLRKAAMHRSTLSKIDSIHGRDVAHIYAMACPEAQILSAAAADPNLSNQHDFMISIQRTLWSDSHSSAIGTHPAAKNDVVDRIIPGMPWDIAVRLKRIKFWQRLCTNTRAGSWPQHAALTIKRVATIDSSCVQSSGKWLKQLNDDIVCWIDPLGILTIIPTPRIDSHARRVRCDATVVLPHVSNEANDSFGPVANAQPAVQDTFDGVQHSLERWQQAGWRGAALDMCLFGNFDALPLELDDDQHRLEGNTWTSIDWVHLHDESSWAGENTEASEWKRALHASAIEEAESRWLTQQLAYVSHDPLLGRGEMAMWNKLKTRPRISDHLLVLDHKKLTTRQRDAISRILAGCILTSNAWCCKRRMCAVWRDKNSSDAQRELAVMCPCGGGPQDSLHCLECTLPALIRIHESVLRIALAYLEGTTNSIHLLPWAKRRHRRIQTDRTLCAWKQTPKDRQLELTLGAQGQEDLCDEDHANIVSLCVPDWAQVEASWK
jgi:hypothetical protein